MELFCLLGLLAVTSGQFCTKRFIGGKWEMHGDCGSVDRNFVSKDLQTKDRARKAVNSKSERLKSCENVKFEDIPVGDRNETGGQIKIELPNVGLTDVYCDVVTDGGHWTVFQRRMRSGVVSFERKWSDYVKLFGHARKDYWLGLEAIHQLTKNGNQELRIDMIHENGTYFTAKFSHFKVGPASDKYRLSVRGYSGNVTNSLSSQHNNQQFSTPDSDNDRAPEKHCAEGTRSGWWFNACYTSSLNGMPGNIIWHHDGKVMRVQSSEMKLRNRRQVPA